MTVQNLSIAESNPELLIREDDICCFKRARHGREWLGTLAWPMPRQIRLDIQRRYRRRPLRHVVSAGFMDVPV